MKAVYLFDSDGFFNGTSIAQIDPKTGKLLMPENATETKPDNDNAFFFKWNGKKWEKIAKPATLDDCVKIGAVSHSSVTLHDTELKTIFIALTEGSETHKIKRGDDLSWSVVRKPEKSPEDKKAERIAELKSLLASTDYIVLKIEGEYATLKNIENGNEVFIALALLPDGTDVGTKIHSECFEYTIAE
jgi:hypothetical protein